jgi:hypothetical protein
MDFRIICQVQGGTLKPRTRRIARIDCHKTAFSASPDQRTTLALYCRVIASYAAAGTTGTSSPQAAKLGAACRSRRLVTRPAFAFRRGAVHTLDAALRNASKLSKPRPGHRVGWWNLEAPRRRRLSALSRLRNARSAGIPFRFTQTRDARALYGKRGRVSSCVRGAYTRECSTAVRAQNLASLLRIKRNRRSLRTTLRVFASSISESGDIVIVNGSRISALVIGAFPAFQK